jgi:hypothetical protein
MDCRSTFTLNDYLALIKAAQAGGYEFNNFADDDGRPGVAFLRHDIDKDVAQARRMAEVEYKLGIRASYFFLLRCPLYSLLEPETLAHVKAIAGMNHWVGLHCDERRMMAAQEVTFENFEEGVLRELKVLETVVGVPCSRVVSFHNPTTNVIGHVPKSADYINAYDPRFMMPLTKYISDSNSFWREGDPVPNLENRVWPRVQILVHPIWWTAEGPELTTTTLSKLVEKRAGEVDAYLRWSNDIWRDFCEERETERKVSTPAAELVGE